jgi:hypothetical protein
MILHMYIAIFLAYSVLLIFNMKTNTLLITTLCLCLMAVVACENPSNSQSLKAKNAPASKLGSTSEAQSKTSKQSAQAQFAAINMQLLHQSHYVFLAVWKKMFTLEDGTTTVSDSKRSVFKEALKTVQSFIADDGIFRKDKSTKLLPKANNCTQDQLEIKVEQDQQNNLRLLIFQQDCNKKMTVKWAELKSLKEGQLLWQFNPQYFPEGVGNRLAAFGPAKIIQCLVSYDLKTLKSLECKNLGQDEGEGKHYEFAKFKFNNKSEDSEVEAEFLKYNNMTDVDKKFKVSANWGNSGIIKINVQMAKKDEAQSLTTLEQNELAYKREQEEKDTQDKSKEPIAQPTKIDDKKNQQLQNPNAVQELNMNEDLSNQNPKKYPTANSANSANSVKNLSENPNGNLSGNSFGNEMEAQNEVYEEQN